MERILEAADLEAIVPEESLFRDIGRLLTLGLSNVEQVYSLACKKILVGISDCDNGIENLLEYREKHILKLLIKNFFHIKEKKDIPRLEEIIDMFHIIMESSESGLEECIKLRISLLSFLVEENCWSFALQLESAKLINLQMENQTEPSAEIQESPICKDFIKKFDKCLSLAGDYELQATLIELLFRLMKIEEKQSFVGSWFQSYLVQTSFMAIRNEEFETDCRRFLNLFNSFDPQNQRVFSFPAICVALGRYQLQKPRDNKVSEFWIDFNMKSGSISSFVNDDKSNEQNSQWEMINIRKDMVKDFRVNVTEDSIVLILKLLSLASDLAPFCPLAPEHYVKIVFHKKGEVTKAIEKLFGEVKYVNKSACSPGFSPSLRYLDKKMSGVISPLSLKSIKEKREITAEKVLEGGGNLENTLVNKSTEGNNFENPKSAKDDITQNSLILENDEVEKEMNNTVASDTKNSAIVDEKPPVHAGSRDIQGKRNTCKRGKKDSSSRDPVPPITKTNKPNHQMGKDSNQNKVNNVETGICRSPVDEHVFKNIESVIPDRDEYTRNGDSVCNLSNTLNSYCKVTGTQKKGKKLLSTHSTVFQDSPDPMYDPPPIKDQSARSQRKLSVADSVQVSKKGRKSLAGSKDKGKEAAFEMFDFETEGKKLLSTHSTVFQDSPDPMYDPPPIKDQSARSQRKLSLADSVQASKKGRKSLVGSKDKGKEAAYEMFDFETEPGDNADRNDFADEKPIKAKAVKNAKNGNAPSPKKGKNVEVHESKNNITSRPKRKDRKVVNYNETCGEGFGTDQEISAIISSPKEVVENGNVDEKSLDTSIEIMRNIPTSLKKAGSYSKMDRSVTFISPVDEISYFEVESEYSGSIKGSLDKTEKDDAIYQKSLPTVTTSTIVENEEVTSRDSSTSDVTDVSNLTRFLNESPIPAQSVNAGKRVNNKKSDLKSPRDHSRDMGKRNGMDSIENDRKSRIEKSLPKGMEKKESSPSKSKQSTKMTMPFQRNIKLGWAKKVFSPKLLRAFDFVASDEESCVQKLKNDSRKKVEKTDLDNTTWSCQKAKQKKVVKQYKIRKFDDKTFDERRGCRLNENSPSLQETSQDLKENILSSAKPLLFYGTQKKANNYKTNPMLSDDAGKSKKRKMIKKKSHRTNKISAKNDNDGSSEDNKDDASVPKLLMKKRKTLKKQVTLPQSDSDEYISDNSDDNSYSIDNPCYKTVERQKVDNKMHADESANDANKKKKNKNEIKVAQSYNDDIRNDENGCVIANSHKMAKRSKRIDCEKYTTSSSDVKLPSRKKEVMSSQYDTYQNKDVVCDTYERSPEIIDGDQIHANNAKSETTAELKASKKKENRKKEIDESVSSTNINESVKRHSDKEAGSTCQRGKDNCDRMEIKDCNSKLSPQIDFQRKPTGKTYKLRQKRKSKEKVEIYVQELLSSSEYDSLVVSSEEKVMKATKQIKEPLSKKAKQRVDSSSQENSQPTFYSKESACQQGKYAGRNIEMKTRGTVYPSNDDDILGTAESADKFEDSCDEGIDNESVCSIKKELSLLLGSMNSVAPKKKDRSNRKSNVKSASMELNVISSMEVDCADESLVSSAEVSHKLDIKSNIKSVSMECDDSSSMEVDCADESLVSRAVVSQEIMSSNDTPSDGLVAVTENKRNESKKQPRRKLWKTPVVLLKSEREDIEKQRALIAKSPHSALSTPLGSRSSRNVPSTTPTFSTNRFDSPAISPSSVTPLLVTTQETINAESDGLCEGNLFANFCKDMLNFSAVGNKQNIKEDTHSCMESESEGVRESKSQLLCNERKLPVKKIAEILSSSLEPPETGLPVNKKDSFQKFSSKVSKLVASKMQSAWESHQDKRKVFNSTFLKDCTNALDQWYSLFDDKENRFIGLLDEMKEALKEHMSDEKQRITSFKKLHMKRYEEEKKLYDAEEKCQVAVRNDLCQEIKRIKKSLMEQSKSQEVTTMRNALTSMLNEP